MKPQKIYFNGAGLATTLGNTKEATLKAIQGKKHQPSTVTIEKHEGVRNIPYHLIPDPSIALGDVRHFHMIDRVISDALRDAGLTKNDLKSMGLFLGSTSFDMFSVEQKLQQPALSNNDILAKLSGFQNISDAIVNRYEIAGPAYTFNTACTSSANALAYAADFIRSGKIDRALVLGVEFYNETTACGFSSLDLISQRGMRPFDNDRDGLILGEACGALVVSKQPEKHSYGIVAAANIADTYSITTCNPDGSSIAQTIQQALTEAQLSPEDIRLVKTHGTASLSNDESESAGLQSIFNTIPPAVCIKPHIGHTLGACGIVELIIFYHALREKQLIPPRYASNIDSNFKMQFMQVCHTPATGHFLLNYFGFGGNNTALVISND